MSRQPRLDTVRTLHHLMVGGIEGTDIFATRLDWTDFLALGVTRSLAIRYAATDEVSKWES